MKRFFKRAAYFLLFLFVLGIAAYLIYNEELPSGEQGPKADIMAEQLMETLKAENFQITRYLEWDFNGIHQYKWDRQLQKAEVNWGDHKVVLDLNDYGQSQVFTEGQLISGNEADDLINKAVAYFNNDSFWLVAPFKVFDRGTERRVVATEAQGEALLVTYTSGGSTPGDSYLWLFDEQGFPVAFKMWVSIIPIGGLEAGWKQWKITESDTYLPTGHKIGPFNLKLNQVKAYGTITDDGKDD